jgi:hypothetical protein
MLLRNYVKGHKQKLQVTFANSKRISSFKIDQNNQNSAKSVRHIPSKPHNYIPIQFRSSPKSRNPKFTRPIYPLNSIPPMSHSSQYQRHKQLHNHPPPLLQLSHSRPIINPLLIQQPTARGNRIHPAFSVEQMAIGMPTAVNTRTTILELIVYVN